MLQVASNFRVRMDENGQLLGSISQSSGEFCLTADVLVLLSLIAETKGSETKPAALATKLRKQWSELARTLPPAEELNGLLNDLQSAGVLIDRTADQTIRFEKDGLQSDGFGDPWVQWTMVADKARTLAYQKAIATTVKTGDVVVDVGAGSGLLGFMALQAGADRVVAIEETAAAGYAAAIAKKLGYNKKQYQLIQSNSFDAIIPGDTRVVISELFGNDPFQEGVIPTLRNIALRLKKNQVVFVPKHVTCFVETVDIKRCPQLDRIQALQSAATSLAIRDFQTQQLVSTILEKLELTELSFPCHVEASDLASVSKPVGLGDIELSPPSPHLSYRGSVKIDVINTAQTPAVLLWYRVTLTADSGLTLSSSPLQPDYAEHWSPILIPLFVSELKAGVLTVDYELSDAENFLSLKIFQGKELIGSR